MSSYAKEELEDEVDLNELDLDIGSLADQETSDVLDPAPKVRFEVKKAEVRKQYEDPQDKKSKVIVTRLSLQAKISEDGTNHEGANAGRVLFPDFVLAFDK